jgi:hypothetical protein
MFPHNYALEKLSTAVRILATGEGDARSRLSRAYSAFGFLQPDAFPPALHADYESIRKEITKRLPKSEAERREWASDGDAQANIRRMQNRTASKIATKIFDLEHRVRLVYEEWHNNLLRSS